jgi:hypothetical protein
VSIDLYVMPGAVGPVAWGRVYDEVRCLWATHPSGARGVARRVVHGVEVPLYARALEGAERGGRQCAIAGDVASLRFGEPVALPDWGALAARAAARGAAAAGAGGGGDVLFAAGAGRLRLFGGAASGEPYHDLVLAAGLLVEARLPGRAFVTGGLDRARVERARASLVSCLGAEAGPPVVLDAPSLVARLSARRAGEALVASFRRRFAGDEADGLGHVLRAIEDAAAIAWLRAALRAGGVPGRGGPTARVAFAGWLRSGRGPEAFLRAGVEAGVEPDALVVAAVGSGCLLPPHLTARARRACDGLAASGRAGDGPEPRAAALVLGRLELGARVDEAALENAIAAAVPTRTRSLLARARAEAASLAGEVEGALTTLASAPGRVGPPEPARGDGVVSRDASIEDLAPAARASVVRLVDAVVAAWGAYAARDHLPVAPEGLRRLFAAAMARDRLVLTEDAWDAIAAERDVEVLRWLVRLAACDAGGEAVRLKRALLEGAALRREGARLYAERAVLRGGRPPGAGGAPRGRAG